ncbi:MAG: DUF2812 domain-containing protein [Clostridia bacterium]|nr:DUF2812 domain-containing protein [Clostridia bacterium]
MKYKYMLNPPDYAIGESERLYEEMAAKGWLLTRRGSHFSKLRRDEPQTLNYRVELSRPGLFDDAALPEEQIALYEEAGWSHVTSCGLVHIFSSPEGSGAPEFYSDPRQQAATLRGLRKNYRIAMFVALFFLLLRLALDSITYNNDWSQLLRHILFDIAQSLYVNTALTLFICISVFAGIFFFIYGYARTLLLMRRLRRGKPIDRSPRKRYRVMRALRLSLITVCAVLLLLSLLQFAATRSYDLPESADGPYLLLSDLGFDGERRSFKNLTSRETRSRSLLADYIKTSECLGSSSYLDNEVYILRSPRDAERLLRILVAAEPYIHFYIRGELSKMHHDGLDEVWGGEGRYFARRGNTVWRLWCSLRQDEPEFTRLLLDRLAALEI